MRRAFAALLLALATSGVATLGHAMPGAARPFSPIP